MTSRDRHVTAAGEVAPLAGLPSAAGHVTPLSPRTPLSPAISDEIDKIKTLLQPFAHRGYEHDPAFWACMAAQFPGVPLEVEAYNMASWLRKPVKKNREAQCSTGFVINWLKKAQTDADRRARELAHVPKPQTNGAYYAPITQQRNPGPADLVHLEMPLERVDDGERRRALTAAAVVPLKVKLGRVRGTG